MQRKGLLYAFVGAFGALWAGGGSSIEAAEGRDSGPRPASCIALSARMSAPDPGVASAEVLATRGEATYEQELQLFEALTAHAWMRCADGPMAKSCTIVELRADGTYLWSAGSDVVARSDRGVWNWRVSSPWAGALFLSSSGVVRFELSGAELDFPPVGRLEAGAKLEVKGNPSQLKPVTPPALYTELINGPWLKANDFDSYRLPDRIRFFTGGRAAFGYRDGECVHESTWSVYTVDRAGRIWYLLAEARPNRCDVRDVQPTANSFRSPIELLDGTLLLQQPYRRVQDLSEKQVVVLDAGRWRATGTLSGQLVEGETVVLDLQVSGARPQPMRADRVTISLHSLEKQDHGFSYTGESEVLATVDLGGVMLETREKLPIRVSLTPRLVTDWADLRIELEGDTSMPGSVIASVHHSKS